MYKVNLSNTLLSLGILVLLSFGVIEVNGVQSDPLLPAFAALLIGCTAVLDRVSFFKPD
ncbi:MAG: hypothetical protein IT328_05550 [Caldilineaceae bacterium]|nr:hypothetical protein [Caldilineaceae bacterium]